LSLRRIINFPGTKVQREVEIILIAVRTSNNSVKLQNLFFTRLITKPTCKNYLTEFEHELKEWRLFFVNTK